MQPKRKYDLGFEEIEDVSMYNDFTPIVTVNDDYGGPELILVGKEQINHYIKTGEILE
jgi:predicted ThiF/HesA family dinucleotide-utilizing enzyme